MVSNGSQRRSARVVDIHAHILLKDQDRAIGKIFGNSVPRLVGFGSDDVYVGLPQGGRIGPFPRSLVDIRARLHDMDGMGVSTQVLSVPPTHFGYDLVGGAAVSWCRLLNDAMVEVAESMPERFQVLVTLPLQDPVASVAELDRLASRDVVRGVQIGTNVSGKDLDDPDLAPVWELVSAVGYGVFLHPDQRNVAGKERLGRHHLANLVGNPIDTTIAVGSLMLGGVLERYPGLKVGCAHGGGFTPYQIGRWDRAWKQRSDVRRAVSESPRSLLRRMYFDSLTHDGGALRLLGETVGWSQVMLGSDYPFDMGDGRPVATIKETVATEVMDGVLRGNVFRFLR